ncbi:MAG: hypothetical protein ACK5HT_01835 [Draconibacterium sp.]
MQYTVNQNIFFLTELLLSGVRPEVLKELEKHEVTGLLGEGMILPGFDLAISKAREL